MSLRSLVFGVCALTAGAFIVPVAGTTDADAQARSSYRQGSQSMVVRFRDETGQVRTRIVVQPRSYLDGGTQVLPGQRKYTDYISLPGQRPIDVLGPGRGSDRQPLNGPFDYGFRRHP